MGYTEIDISRTLAMYGYQVIKKDELADLRQQNAQLLEALKYIMNWTPDKWNPETARDLARAAIAAVEGNNQ